MEEIQLEAEAGLFDKDQSSSGELTKILGIEDLSSKTKMQRIQIIREGIESKIVGNEQLACTFHELLEYAEGSIPPLERKKIPPLEQQSEVPGGAAVTEVKKQQ